MFDYGELAQMMAERQGMYKFLAGVFRREIDPELFEELGRLDFSAATGVAEIDRGFQLLGEYLRASSGATLTDLAVDYARIFLGSGSGKAGGAFPFESVYTSPRGLLMQEARDRVVEWYRQAGMQRAGGFPVPEDHLALELEYVAQLCEPTSRALESQDGERALACLRAQRAFLEEHLLNWVPRLCEDILRLAATDFYQGIALLSAGYLAADQNLLAELCQAQPAG